MRGHGEREVRYGHTQTNMFSQIQLRTHVLQENITKYKERVPIRTETMFFYSLCNDNRT